jgi:dihydrofolate reductase
VEACLKYLEAFDKDEVFVAGGAEIYRQLLPWCDECLITKVEASFPADRHFENLDAREDFALAWEGESLREGDLRYRFTLYRRLGRNG